MSKPRVKVALEVSEEAPIYCNASASLSFQGITGMKDLLVSPGTRDAGRLPSGSAIRARGGFDLFGAKGESIGAKLDQLLENLGKLTEAGNQRRIADLLDSTNESMQQMGELARSLSATSQAVGALVQTNTAPLRGTVQKTGEAAESVARAADTWDQVGSSARAALGRFDQELSRVDLGGTVESVRQSIASFRELTERAQHMLAQNESELQDAMRNMRRASEDLREFSSAVRQQPSRLLFSDPVLALRALHGAGDGGSDRWFSFGRVSGGCGMSNRLAEEKESLWSLALAPLVYHRAPGVAPAARCHGSA
jgi:ABC-type transporter Mla subunit MlaD